MTTDLANPAVDEPGDAARPRAARSTRRAHIASLDGLRAVAIALVLLFHGGVGWAHGGYLGVDLFFVLSGYLIGAKLIGEQARTGTVGLARFWGGRFRRLLPALLFMLVGVALFAALVAESNAQRGIRNDVYASLAYVVNWHVIFGHVGYFASSAAPSPVRHLWSLSVEEQFYLLFPLLLLGLGKVGRTGRRMAAPITALIVISTLWTAVLAARGADATRLYEGTDTRLATVLLGVLAAIVVREWTKPRQWLDPAAIVSTVVAIAILLAAHGSDRWMYPYGQLLFGVAAAVIVVAVANRTSTLPVRVLALPPFVALGAISYGVYLWHWPIYLVLTPHRTGVDGAALLLIRVLASIAVATVSYRLIEQPIRTRRVDFAHPVIVGVAAVAVVAVLITAVTAGAPSGDALQGRSGPRGTIDVATDGQALPPIHVAPVVSIPPPIPEARKPRVALVGDSAGASLDFYRPNIPAIDYKAGTTIGCGVMAPAVPSKGATIKPLCAGWKDKWITALDGHPDVVLMVLGAWEINPHWLRDQELLPKGIDDTDPATTKYVDGHLDQAVQLIEQKTGARIAALQLACAPKEDLGVGEAQPPRSDPRVVAWFNARLDALAQRHPGVVQVISINDHLCPGGKAVTKLDGTVLRDDGTHWTEASAPIAWRWLLPEILAVGNRQIDSSGH